MPGGTDLYVRVADSEAERAHLADAALCPIPSVRGHRAGDPTACPQDAAFLRAPVRRWMQR